MIDAARLDERIRAALSEPAAPAVVSAYLFGSHAAGRAHRESDIDIGVLLKREAYPDTRARFDARLQLTVRLATALGTDQVDVVVLNDAPPTLVRAIVGVGRRVVCRDRDADHAFVRDALLRAADLGPFLRRARRLQLHRLGR